MAYRITDADGCNNERMAWPEAIAPCSIEDLLDGESPGEQEPYEDSSMDTKVFLERHEGMIEAEGKDGPIKIRQCIGEKTQYAAWLNGQNRKMSTTEMCRL